MTRTDEIFGEVEFNQLWQKTEQLAMYGKPFDIKVFIHGNKQEDFLDIQRSAYKLFKENQAELMKQMEQRIFEYYKTVCEEYRAMYEDEADRFAPSAENSNQLKGFVKLSSITFPRTENERTVIVLFKTKWDLELGVGILLKNEEITLVGVQSDVL